MSSARSDIKVLLKFQLPLPSPLVIPTSGHITLIHFTSRSIKLQNIPNPVPIIKQKLLFMSNKVCIKLQKYKVSTYKLCFFWKCTEYTLSHSPLGFLPCRECYATFTDTYITRPNSNRTLDRWLTKRMR